MLDIEQLAYSELAASVAAVSWSAGWPQDFRAPPVGCVRQTDNTSRLTTSTERERLSDIAVQVQLWAASPESRNAFDEQIDAALSAYGLRRSTLNHLEDTQNDGTVLYRSVFVYSGVYDSTLDRIYQ